MFTFEFTAYNTETLYGYGTEDEAYRYLDWLNGFRSANYQEVSSLTDEEAERVCFNLGDELIELRA